MRFRPIQSRHARVLSTSLIILVLLGAPSMAASADAPSLEWQQDTIEFEEGRYYFDLTVDSQGSPHVVYYSDERDALIYAIWRGGWDGMVIESGDHVGRHASIALDASDRPHVSYYDKSDLDLKYAAFLGGTWHTETVDSAGNVGEVSTIALDDDGRPHIAYRRDATSGDQLKYAHYDGFNWQIEVVESSMDSLGAQPSIALDPLGQPHIVYTNQLYVDSDTGDSYYVYTLYYAHRFGSWASNPIGNDAYQSGHGRSLAIDAFGHSHLVYRDHGANEPRYKYFDGANWHDELVPFVGSASAGSVALDDAGRVHVANYANYCIWYAVKDGDWQIQAAACPSLSEAFPVGHLALGIGPDGEPHIAYNHYETPGLAHTWGQPSAHEQIPAIHAIVEQIESALGNEGRVSQMIDNAKEAVLDRIHDASDFLHGDHQALEDAILELRAKMHSEHLTLLGLLEEIKVAVSAGGYLDHVIHDAKVEILEGQDDVRTALADRLGLVKDAILEEVSIATDLLTDPDDGLVAVGNAVESVDVKLRVIDVKLVEGAPGPKGQVFYLLTSFAGRRLDASVVAVEADGSLLDTRDYAISTISSGLSQLEIRKGAIDSRDPVPLVVEVEADVHAGHLEGVAMILVEGK